MKKDLIIVGLAYCLLIQQGVSIHTNYKLNKAYKDLQSTKEVVWYISDKLDTAYGMIGSLNAEQKPMQDEINECGSLRRLKKDLR